MSPIIFIFTLEFCPVHCEMGNKQCPGKWENGQQITPDTCIPMKVGDCTNHCPVNCAPGDMMCPGKMDPNGCKMPDTCHSGSKFLIYSQISFLN